MFIGRKSEQKFMQEQYQSETESFVILYGRQGIGKTRLLMQFLQGKQSLYYCAREASEREQFLQMRKEWLGEDSTVENYKDLFQLVLEMEATRKDQDNSTEKLVIVIDEYHQMHRGNNQILDGLRYCLQEFENRDQIMIVLISSSIVWSENHMVRSFGMLATQITAYIKVKEFTFLEMVARFPDASVEEVIGIYSLLGGVPGYLELWNEKQSFKENVVRLCLSPTGPLYQEPIQYLKQERRELGDYNSILATLARRQWKLNLLHHRTGFNRPKVSVYIKNLMQMDVTEKIFSYDALNHENSQKGLYAIRESYLEFWYRFVYPNLSLLELGRVEEVYENKIKPELHDFTAECYIKVCKEYLALMNQYKKLPFEYTSCGSWYGKKGSLDMIALAESENRKQPCTLVGQCKWSDEPLHRTDYQAILETMEQAGVRNDYIYIFSKSGFDQECQQMAAVSDKLVLIDLDSL